MEDTAECVIDIFRDFPTAHHKTPGTLGGVRFNGGADDIRNVEEFPDLDPDRILTVKIPRIGLPGFQPVLPQ